MIFRYPPIPCSWSQARVAADAVIGMVEMRARVCVEEGRVMMRDRARQVTSEGRRVLGNKNAWCAESEEELQELEGYSDKSFL